MTPDGRPIAGARVRLASLKIPKQRDLDAYIEYVTSEDNGRDSGPEFKRFLKLPIPLAGFTQEMRTDADGRFRLSGLGRDRLVELEVSAPSVSDATIAVMTRKMREIGTFRSGRTKSCRHGRFLAWRALSTGGCHFESRCGRVD
jgi:hypothetical protein